MAKAQSIERGKRVLAIMKQQFGDTVLDQKLVNFLKGLPPMIMQNGLGQTIAYITSKSKDNNAEGTNNYGAILAIFKNVFEEEDLMDKIIKMEIKDYLRSQKEAIEYAGWMKKFALAFYSKSSGEESDVDTSSE